MAAAPSAGQRHRPRSLHGVRPAASGLVFGFDERLKGGGGQGFSLARRMPGGWSVRAPEATCADGYRAEGWFPQLGRDERRALCRGSSFEPPPERGDPE